MTPFFQKLGRMFQCWTLSGPHHEEDLVKPLPLKFFLKPQLILFLTGILGLYGFFFGSCQETLGYTDIRSGANINIYVDIDAQTGNASRQILLLHFLFFPSGAPESLDDEESFKTAAVIQSEYAGWTVDTTNFAKLIHFVPLAAEQLNNPEVTRKIKEWATKNSAITTVVANTDIVVTREVGARGTPLMRISIYTLEGKVWKSDTADPREPEESPETWKEKLFKLMDDYFWQYFKIDEVQDWVTWLGNMKRVLPQRDLFTRYLELGKDRLKKGNQGGDYRELPICEVPPPLSEQDSKRIDMAIRAFQGAIKEKPNEAEAYNYLGTSYYRKRDYENALPNFQNAVNLDDTEPTYLHNLVMAYLKIGKTQEARATLERWLKQHPEDGGAKEIRKHIPGVKGGGDEPYLWLAALTLSGAAVLDFGYTEVYPRTPPENAADELTRAKSISPPLAPGEFEKQRTNWGNYKKFSRRATMLDLTAVNLLVNSVPFWLDARNWKSPMGKGWMSLAYGAKGAFFSVFALYYADKAKDAEDDEAAAAAQDLKQHFYGLRQQANETKRWSFINAGIDAVTIGLLLWFDPNDEGSGSQGESRRAPNRFELPLGFNVRSDGQNTSEILVFVKKTF